MFHEDVLMAVTSSEVGSGDLDGSRSREVTDVSHGDYDGKCTRFSVKVIDKEELSNNIVLRALWFGVALRLFSYVWKWECTAREHDKRFPIALKRVILLCRNFLLVWLDRGKSL